MEVWLSTGFSLFIVGLNVEVTRYILQVTDEIPAAKRCGLIKNGGIITLLGIVLVGIGIAMWNYKCGLRPGGWNDVIKIGAAVVAVGVALIIRAIGHGHLTAIKRSTWPVMGVGGLFLLVYFIAPYIMPYIQNILKSMGVGGRASASLLT